MQNIKFNNEELLHLLEIYQEEWKFRDQLHWSQMYKLFYAILIFTILPYIAEGIRINLDHFPKIVFPIIGLLISFVWLLISLGYIKKVDATLERYDSLLNTLPEQYQRENFDNKHIKGIFKIPRSYIICYTLFIALFVLSLTLINFELF